MSAVSIFMGVFVGVFVGMLGAMELSLYLERRRENPEETETLGQKLRALLPQEKAEFMLPMNDKEYEDYMEKQTSEGELMSKIKAPWKSHPPKSP